MIVELSRTKYSSSNLKFEMLSNLNNNLFKWIIFMETKFINGIRFIYCSERWMRENFSNDRFMPNQLYGLCLMLILCSHSSQEEENS